MNTNHLKRFAQNARTKLLEQINARLEQVLATDSAELREKAGHLRKLQEAINKSSKAEVVDAVAYTWFNRLVALRFMDVNGYEPIAMQVVSPVAGATLPELLQEAKAGRIPEELPVNAQRIYDILDGKLGGTSPQNEAYRELLVGACNHLNKTLPFLFEKIDDYAELLLPDDLISEFSILQDIKEGMTPEDCTEVEIIGWLYQFYISEKKDEVFAGKGKVKKEDIPAATQLFTPRWIVEYMVQNTVGKLWLQNNPKSGLREHMPYFIESPSVAAEDYLKIDSVEDITLLDQACGSGHILVYGFELLSKIYEEEGYNESEIPQLIIEKNLYGFEIDTRAAQLAGLALMLKARQYYRRVFKKDVAPNIACYQDLSLSMDEIKDTFKLTKISLSDELLHDLITMQQAINFGSLIIPHTPTGELETIRQRLSTEVKKSDLFGSHDLDAILRAVQQLIALSQKYHCVVDNPPYMGGGNMNKPLADYVKTNYPKSKADLMTCFMEAGWNMLLPNGILGMINLPSWLFLSSFQKLREKLIKEKHINSLLHMGRGIFGVDWGSTAFIIQNQNLKSNARYFKLHKRNFQHLHSDDIRQIFLKAKNDENVKVNFDQYRDKERISSIDKLIGINGSQISYQANQKDFQKIHGSPIGYWLKKNQIESLIEDDSLGDLGKTRRGLQPGNTPMFVREWYEVERNDLFINENEEFKNKISERWVLLNSGGRYRKWYGNLDSVVNWRNDGLDIKNLGKGIIPSEHLYFKKAIVWNKITSGTMGFRFQPLNVIPGDASPGFFPANEEDINYILGVLNSKIIQIFLELFSPTLNAQVGDLKKLPIKSTKKNLVADVVELLIGISKQEWHSREEA